MASNVYALLVGIDNYAAPVTPLQGCINDVKAIEEYLKARVQTDGWNLKLKVLKDEEATRQGIIDGFRHHLCQASSNDVVLFYYSGHGSQENAPPEFWEWQPEKVNETLVCYDSRSEGGWDLADKELAKLISEVAQNNPHITLILDCCHSGSGTRDPFQETAVREFDADVRTRPLESFIFSPQEIRDIGFAERNLSNQQKSGWNIPRGKHILFASCQNFQTAKEYRVDGEHRGAFCYFLTQTLQQTQGNLTYRDLFKRVDALVRSKVKQQSPQLEATDSQELDQLFLGGALQTRHPYYTVSHDKQYGWIIDGGAVHGVPRPQAGETMHLALFTITTPNADLQKLKNKIAEARVTEVYPQLSQITVDGVTELDPQTTFKAVITKLPLPPKGVHFVGEAEGIKLLQQALQNIDNSQPSAYLREVSENESAEFKVVAENGEYMITRPADGVPLVNQIPDYTPASAAKVIQRLEHITRWTNLNELASPANSSISGDAIALEIHHNDQIIQDSAIRFHYDQDGSGKWKRPTFKIKLKNNSDRTLYCALLDLTEKFAINAGFFEAGYVKLEPGQQTWAFGGKLIPASVPDDLWQQGITEYQDILKLIVCTNNFDARLLEQDKLDLPRKKYHQRGSRSSTLNRLMERWQGRDFILDEPTEELDDWFATQVIAKTIRPLETTAVPHTGRGISLGGGVELKPHPGLQAQVRLSSIDSNQRNADNYHLPPLLRQNPNSNQPFPLTNSRSIGPSANVLELTEVDNATIATVTRENPFKLVVDTPLAPGEKVLPIAYDGEFYYPLGVGYSHQGRTEIRLEQLPTPEESGERSIKSAFKIYFQKVASEKLGFAYDYPQLAVAKINADETVSYETDLLTIKQQVAQARKIVLFIHGIIGDTAGLIPGLAKAKVTVAGQEKPLAETYDLILGFDYENLNTTIEENARLLKQRLADIGLGANHGKQLDIVAHSMGGLVSRWLIEREGGNQMINHLVMLGTPNAGSPWSTIQDWVWMLLTLGLNSISTVALPIQILGNSLAALETIDVSLDQMRPGSDFLKTLAASPDPGIPYTIIAGNNTAVSGMGETRKLQRLLDKMTNKSIYLAFLGQVNDIAVTVSSIVSVNAQRTPQPHTCEITSNHLNYFCDTAGVNALATALMGNMKPL